MSFPKFKESLKPQIDSKFFTCMHLYFIENDLSKHGYRMEDLPCYRHWLAHQPA